MATQTPAAQRLYFLDWLRILAFALLILYHVGMYYVSWGWHIKSVHASEALIPWMLLSAPWRLSLLFLLAGAAISMFLAGRGSQGFLKARAKRLLVPLLFGMLVVVPPQAWLEVVHKYGYEGSFAAFMLRYLSADGSFCSANGECLILPTWNHLWFVAYLWFYTALLWLLLRLRPDALDLLAGRMGAALRGWRLMLLPFGVLLALRLVLWPRFGSTHALVDDWYNHAQYFSLFLLGAVMARMGSAWQDIERLRWPALAVAAAAWVLLVLGIAAGVPAGSTAGMAARAAGQWFTLLAVLGFGHRHLNRDHPLRKRLGEAVFPVYILHQTLIIVLAHGLAPFGLDPFLEAPLLIAGTFSLSLAGYAIVRRIRWLAPALGLAAPVQTPLPCATTNKGYAR